MGAGVHELYLARHYCVVDGVERAQAERLHQTPENSASRTCHAIGFEAAAPIATGRLPRRIFGLAGLRRRFRQTRPSVASFMHNSRPWYANMVS